MHISIVVNLDRKEGRSGSDFLHCVYLVLAGRVCVDHSEPGVAFGFRVASGVFNGIEEVVDSSVSVAMSNHVEISIVDLGEEGVEYFGVKEVVVSAALSPAASAVVIDIVGKVIVLVLERNPIRLCVKSSVGVYRAIVHKLCPSDFRFARAVVGHNIIEIR